MDKTGCFEKRNQLLFRISVLTMFFIGALPQVTLPLKQIHSIGADICVLVKFAPPNTIYIIIFIKENLIVHGAEFFRCIDIKNKDTAGIQCLICTSDRLSAVSRVRNIVQTVQCTDCHVHPFGKIQPLQRLAYKTGWIFHILNLLERLCEHFFGHIHTDHNITFPGQKLRHGACTAGKIGNGTGV